MTDRRLREQGNAWDQRMAFSERRIRGMRLRSNPGAVRTTSPAPSFVPPTTLVAPSVSLTVPSGRWIVHGQADFVATGAGAGTILFRLGVGFADPAFGVEPERLVADVPYRTHMAPYTGDVIIPMSCYGDFIIEANTVISLISANEASSAVAYSLQYPRLTLSPV